MTFTPEQKDLIIAGLQMHMCVIETGTHTSRAIDAEHFNSSLTKASLVSRLKVKALDRYQRDLINAMEDIIESLK